MRTWCASGARAPTSGIRRTRKPCRSFSAFSTPNAARETRLCSRKRSFAANRRYKVNTDVKEIVQEKYGEAARRVRTGAGPPADCCAKTSRCDGAAASSCDPITSDLYDEAQKDGVPEKAMLASLGCGNPTALAE